MKRKAAVAGRFYPSSVKSLDQMIENCYLDKDFGPKTPLTSLEQKGANRIIGGIVPHAGYVYSGAGVAWTLSEIYKDGLPDTFIIFGTTHTGYRGIATMKEGTWNTPYGDIEIDNDLAAMIIDNTQIKDDFNAFGAGYHSQEHNIEVQLPWIQHAANLSKKKIQIVPIVIGVFEFEKIEIFAKKLAAILKGISKKQIKILASSDMTHKQVRNQFKPEQEVKEAKEADNKVINAINEMNAKKTFEMAEKTTVCGPQTITTLILIAKELGYDQPKVLTHYTSFEKMGSKPPCDYSVGYLSVVFSKI